MSSHRTESARPHLAAVSIRRRARNGGTKESQASFAAGGAGIFIGDVQLNYRDEKILEKYCAIAPQQMGDAYVQLSVRY